MNRVLITIVYVFSLVAVYASKEQLHIVTDRSIYISGESILYSCVLISEMQQENMDWSNSIYIQLVDNSGEMWSHQVVVTDKKGARGQLLIPADIPSGFYLLHAETRWMRNMSIQNSSLKTIKVINPGEDIKYVRREDDFFDCKEAGEGGLKFELGKKSCNTRDSLELAISSYVRGLADPGTTFAVSVAEYGSNQEFELPEIQGINRQGDVFFPESKGMILSGKVVNQKTPYSLVHVSLFRDELGVYSAYTDGAGCFRMGLPFGFGAVESFVYCDDSTLQTELIPQYRYLKTNFPVLIELSSVERDLIQKLNFRAQVHNQDMKASIPTHGVNKRFYGTPDYRINFEDYIKLPTVQEYFFELFPTVSIRQVKHKRKVIFTNEPYSNSVYEPLLLLDMMKLRGVDDILSLHPEDISHIEVVDKNYRFGGQVYSGILSIFSKKNDFAKQKIPSNGFFFNLDLYANPVKWQNIQAHNIKDSHMPLNKNCLYWKTDLTNNDLNNLKFYTGDQTGEFEIVVTGITSEGKVIEGRTTFVVK